jgi:hypothetical protein
MFAVGIPSCRQGKRQRERTWEDINRCGSNSVDERSQTPVLAKEERSGRGCGNMVLGARVACQVSGGAVLG